MFSQYTRYTTRRSVYTYIELKSSDNFIDIYMHTAIFSKTVIYSIRETKKPKIITLNILYVYIYYIYKTASQIVSKLLLSGTSKWRYKKAFHNPRLNCCSEANKTHITLKQCYDSKNFTDGSVLFSSKQISLMETKVFRFLICFSEDCV